MRHARRVHAMTTDPDLTGDSLLLAICLSDILERRAHDKALHVRTKTASGMFREAAHLAIADADAWTFWLRRVLRKDTPRYEPNDDNHGQCSAPMIRREGPCGKRTHRSWVDRDPVTGEATWTGYCTRHFTLDAELAHNTRISEWKANGQPTPAPNNGGILPRYFATNWAKWYRWASPSYEPTPDGKPAMPPRPVFRLIHGG